MFTLMFKVKIFNRNSSSHFKHLCQLLMKQLDGDPHEASETFHHFFEEFHQLLDRRQLLKDECQVAFETFMAYALQSGSRFEPEQIPMINHTIGFFLRLDPAHLVPRPYLLEPWFGDPPRWMHQEIVELVHERCWHYTCRYNSDKIDELIDKALIIRAQLPDLFDYLKIAEQLPEWLLSWAPPRNNSNSRLQQGFFDPWAQSLLNRTQTASAPAAIWKLAAVLEADFLGRVDTAILEQALYAIRESADPELAMAVLALPWEERFQQLPRETLQILSCLKSPKRLSLRQVFSCSNGSL